MYCINKSNFLILLMVFSAMTYFSTSFGSEYRLIARGDERMGGEGGGDRREGGGQQNRGYEDRGGSQGYSNYGHSYSQQGRGAAAYGAGAAAGSSNQNQGNTQYVPVDTYQPNSQPVENYPYTQNPY